MPNPQNLVGVVIDIVNSLVIFQKNYSQNRKSPLSRLLVKFFSKKK